MTDTLIEPYHDGERAVQERAGERHQAVLNGRVVAAAVPAPAIGFVASQAFAALGWRDPEGDLWAGLIAGGPGFAAASEDGRAIAMAAPGGPAAIPPMAAMRAGDRLGTLFVDLSTRRRLRANGRVERVHDDRLILAVEEAYPNCPKYIQRRRPEEGPAPTPPGSVREGTALDDDLRDWIAGADTAFVASAHPDGPADVNHRGGPPGCARGRGEVLRIPDYPGNAMFNTLGNIASLPRAGLCVPDFAGGRQLMLTGEARLDLGAGEARGETLGTGRWWELRIARWVEAPLACPPRLSSPEPSPFNPGG